MKAILKKEIYEKLTGNYPRFRTAVRSITDNPIGQIIIRNLTEEYSKLLNNQLWEIEILDAMYLGEKERKLALILYWLDDIFTSAGCGSRMSHRSLDLIMSD